MLASELIRSLEKRAPPELALENDMVGYLGDHDPDELEINRVQVMLDILPGHYPSLLDADLVICHHPPLFEVDFPVYVMHSNWDIVKGGANDALAEFLNLDVQDIFDKETGIGRICTTSVSFKEFFKRVVISLPAPHFNLMNCDLDEEIEKIAVISGFGLSKPEYMKLAHDNQIDLLLSGDINHRTALLARILDLRVIDASHYATEIPGVIKLGELVSSLGVETQMIDGEVPWYTIKL